jgi:lipid-A-disaccharide synthase
VNLIANGELVPELVADGMNVNNIRKHLLPLLADTVERKAQLDGYDKMSEILGSAGASIKAATQIVDSLNK